MPDLTDMSIQYVKGVGPAKKKLFANLGVENIEDLLYPFPRRYEDRRHITPVAQVTLGEWQTVTGTIKLLGARRSWYTKKHVTEIVIDDKSGRLFCVWFNQPYLTHYFKDGKRIVCYGKVDQYKNRLQMISPEYEIIEKEDDEHLSLSRIVPVYPLTRGLTQRYLRRIVKYSLDNYKNRLADELPVRLRNKFRLYNIKRSLSQIHFPDEFKDQEEALRRISFEEFYFFQASVMLRRLSITQKEGVAHKITDAAMERFIRHFPFTLTRAQKKVIGEIRSDMEKKTPMLRLLQGDVGSGKTIVALFGCAMAFENKCQAAFMAPTEILAKQHYENVVKMFGGSKRPRGKGLKGQRTKVSDAPTPLIPDPFNPKIALLTSSLPKSDRERILKDIQAGHIDIIIGTHSLINEEVCFKSLSFVVIDEQHKFGVRQRALLAEKGSNPDILIMTATPIPRTLCITLYGDLDISVIDEMPPGRGSVQTKHYCEEKVQEAYQFVRGQLKEGRQAYVIFPIIEESQTSDLKAAKECFKNFQKDEFKDFKVGLVHGQMKREEAHKVMEDFRNKEVDLLVATTILEVGVDVPNASIMVIEHAERFGLAQLHQLRGRIGRGSEDAYCLLISDPTTEEGQLRLKAVLESRNGFEIAQRDLEIRGPGKFFGRHQHGLNELKVANPMTQLDILEQARQEARALLESDPHLEQNDHLKIREVIKRRYPTYLAMVKGG